MTTTHRVEPTHPGRTLCCDKAIAELPASAALVFQDGQGVTCPNVNTADNLHLALAQALNRPSTTGNRELVREAHINAVQLAGHKQTRRDLEALAARAKALLGELPISGGALVDDGDLLDARQLLTDLIKALED